MQDTRDPKEPTAGLVKGSRDVMGSWDGGQSMDMKGPAMNHRIATGPLVASEP